MQLDSIRTLALVSALAQDIVLGSCCSLTRGQQANGRCLELLGPARSELLVVGAQLRSCAFHIRQNASVRCTVRGDLSWREDFLVQDRRWVWSVAPVLDTEFGVPCAPVTFVVTTNRLLVLVVLSGCPLIEVDQATGEVPGQFIPSCSEKFARFELMSVRHVVGKDGVDPRVYHRPLVGFSVIRAEVIVAQGKRGACAAADGVVRAEADMARLPASACQEQRRNEQLLAGNWQHRWPGTRLRFAPTCTGSS